MLGTNRSKRYAVVVKNGKVESVHVEPDNIGTSGMHTSNFPAHARENAANKSRSLDRGEGPRSIVFHKEHMTVIETGWSSRS